MKNILLTLSYEDTTGKFWWDSYVKNKVISFDPEKETIHEVIKNVCEEEGMELTYKGKPKGNIYRDLKDGGSKIVGYHYRGKSEIHDRNMVRPVMVYWTIWAEIREVKEFEFEKMD